MEQLRHGAGGAVKPAVPCQEEKHLLLLENYHHYYFATIQFSSVAQMCLSLCSSMDCSMLGLPVHHKLQELAQIYVLKVSDAIQPSHPLLFPSPPAFNLSQHQGLFQ